MIDVSADYLDFVLRFERLDKDFSAALERIGMKMIRPLPVMNKTKGRASDWESYYSQAMIPRLISDYGPFMRRWGYDFPVAWGHGKVSRGRQLEYRISIMMKKIYLTHYRYNDSTSAKLVRKANAALKRRVYS